MSINITTPVGRIVQGKLWEPNPQTDDKGQPKLDSKGQPAVSYFFSLAIPKQPGHTHWAQTDWGKQIWDEGNRAHPQFAPHPNFAWKIEDGDSQVPNKKGRKNADREGFPGHWIIKFSSNFPIQQTWDATGQNRMPPEAFKPGNYAQVFCQITGNTGPSPGIYINPEMVALSGYGAEIIAGPDVSAAGFGGQPLPAGASAVPLAAPAGFAPPAGAPTPGAAPAMFAPPAAPASAPPRPPVPVTPHPGFLSPGAAPAVPGSPAAPGIPAVPPVPAVPPSPTSPTNAGPVMLPAAQGATYQQLIAAGWNDALLRQHGMMQ